MATVTTRKVICDGCSKEIERAASQFRSRGKSVRYAKFNLDFCEQCTVEAINVISFPHGTKRPTELDEDIVDAGFEVTDDE